MRDETDKRPRTVSELRTLCRGLIGLVLDQDPHLAELLQLFDERLTRLEDRPLPRASTAFRTATEDLRAAREEVITKPIPPATAESLRRSATPGYGVQAKKTTERGLGLPKKDHED
jgi:hypothetical protein